MFMLLRTYEVKSDSFSLQLTFVRLPLITVYSICVNRNATIHRLYECFENYKLFFVFIRNSLLIQMQGYM